MAARGRHHDADCDRKSQRPVGRAMNSEDGMTVIDQEALVVRLWYQELWDNWKLDVADTLFTDDYRLHLSGVPAPLDKGSAP